MGDQRIAWPLGVWAAAAAVGFLLCLPDFLILHHRHFYQTHFPEAAARWELNGTYTAISPLDDADSHSYAGRVRDAADHGWPQDPHIKENHSPRLATVDGLAFYLLGRLQRLTGDISLTWLTARWLAGMACFLGFYFFIARASGNRSFALACAAAGVLFFDLYEMVLIPLVAHAPHALKSSLGTAAAQFFWFLGNYQHTFGMGRIIRPGISYPPLLLASYCAARSTVAGKARPLLISGLVGGALAYIHPDVWYVYVVAGSLYLLLCGWRDRRLPFGLLASLMMTAVISLPWIYFNHATNQELLLRSWATLSRSFNSYGLIFAAAGFLCLRFSRRDPLLSFLACLLGATALALETQCLTGYNSDTIRWLVLGGAFIFLAAAGLGGRRLRERSDYVWLAVLAGAFFIGRAVSYAAQRFPFQALPRPIEQAFAYLNAQTPRDSVVVSLGPQETMMLPVYTHNKTLLATGCLLVSDLPTQENLQRLRRGLELYGIPDAALLQKLSAPELVHPTQLPRWNLDLWQGVVNWQDAEWSTFFHFYTLGLDPRSILERFKALEGSPPDRRAEADYLWVGSFERGLMPRGALSRLGHPVYQNQAVQIFKLR